MKTYGEADIKRQNWGGLRKTLKAPLYNRLVNRAVVGVLRSAPATKWRARVPVMEPSAEFALANGERVSMLEPHRCSVARNLFWSDGSLPDPADMLAIHMAEAMAREADIFLDIGAYTGLFALVAARANPALEARAFEILPATYMLLVRNILANNLYGRVEPLLTALGKGSGSVRMPLETGLSGLPTSLSLGSEFSEGIDVPTARLDDVMAGCDKRVAIKIDVEGFEGDVLEGGQEFLARVRPDIVCEVLRSSTCAEQIAAILKPIGYRFHQFTDDGLVEHDAIEPSAAGRDWLFTTRDAPLAIPS